MHVCCAKAIVYAAAMLPVHAGMIDECKYCVYATQTVDVDDRGLLCTRAEFVLNHKHAHFPVVANARL